MLAAMLDETLSPALGTNALETQTNYFLNHWIPNLRGTSLDKKKAEFGTEPVEKGRIVIVDPRRTVTVNACEVEAGKDNVVHLALNSGTDLVLFNAWMTYIADKGWLDKAFIDASTTNFDQMRGANKVSLEDAAKLTGLTVDQIRKSAEWSRSGLRPAARRRQRHPNYRARNAAAGDLRARELRLSAWAHRRTIPHCSGAGAARNRAIDRPPWEGHRRRNGGPQLKRFARAISDSIPSPGD